MTEKKRNRTTLFILFLIILSTLSFAFFTFHAYLSRIERRSIPPDTLSVQPQPPDSTYWKILYQADQSFKQKKYEQCLIELEKAQKLKPQETTIQERIIQLKGLIAQQKKTREEYQKAVASADTYFNSKDYLNAKAAYQIAIDIDPDESYARDRLNETMQLLRANKAQNILYDVAIASAAKLFAAKEYDKAIREYENAGKILPGESYPKDKINEIIKIQVDLQVKEEMYVSSVTKADNFFTAGNYQGSLLEYKNALKYKPGEKYPQDRIAELTELINQKKAIDDAYQEAVANADLLFNQQRLPEAKEYYTEAGKIKPKEHYPPSKIKEIDDILTKKKLEDDQYFRLISLADSSYIERNFMRARQNYQMALQVKPNEPYPKEMLKKTESGVITQQANAEALEEAYNSAITQGDLFFTQKAFEQAKTEYSNALLIKPAESYPKNRMTEIDGLIAGFLRQKKLDDQYDQLLLTGDSLFSAGDYFSAKGVFQTALTLKPIETYPKEKINEIDQKLANLSRQQALDDQYREKIALADRLYDEQSWAASRTAYQQALDLKPAETYPQTRIQEIDQELAEIARLAALDQQYQGIIAGAEKLFTAQSYKPAKTEFEQALTLKPDEDLPKTRIAQIDSALLALADLKALEERYQQLITDGDKQFSDQAYEQANETFTLAGSIKPLEIYPKERVAEINGILAEIARQKALDEQYARLIKTGDSLFLAGVYPSSKNIFQSALTVRPAESYPKQKIEEIDLKLTDLEKQKALDDQYNSRIAEADKLFDEESWAASKTTYQQALGLKPIESYPKNRIGEIDQKLAEIARLAALDQQYQGIIAGAEKLFTAKSYEPAKKEFEHALSLKPDEMLPKARIAQIDSALLAIANQQALDEQYQQLIADGDKKFANKAYEQSKATYTQAMSVKPSESYPKNRIEEIDGILAEMARQKQLDDHYDRYIKTGDSLFIAGVYPSAKNSFESAISLKPAETYPKEKIAEINLKLTDLEKQKALDDQYNSRIAEADKLFDEESWAASKTTYQQALGLKPIESYPKNRIGEIDQKLAEIARLAALDQQYQGIIAGAEKLFTAKSYEPAKKEFEQALSLKPDEMLPKARIAQIDSALLAIANQQALDEQYRQLILSGDQHLSMKKYAEARESFFQANSLKPDQTYPKTKLNELDAILEELAKRDEMYQSAVLLGDQKLAEHVYGEAKTAFLEASKIKPEESYPKEKIVEIDAAVAELARLKAIDDEYTAIIAKADKLFLEQSYGDARAEYQRAGKVKSDEIYWKEKTAEIDQILEDIKQENEAYMTAITKGDLLFTSKQYEEARAVFEEAGAMKPVEVYPREKISEINNILAELEGRKTTYDKLISNGDQSISDKDYYKAKETFVQASNLFPDETYPKQRITFATSKIDSIFRANKSDYDLAIAEGDRYFNTYEFDKAVDSYIQASTFLPNERYPRDMISKIRKTIAENAIVDVLTSPVTIKEGEEQKFSFEPVNMAARKNNFIYVKLKNLSTDSYNVLIRYGKDSQTYGGAAIRNIPVGEEIAERLINVKNQDPWYREDNNWISVYPQGGDIEVTFIQVSRAIK